MSEIVQFPGAELLHSNAAQQVTDQEKIHAQAFFDSEREVCDLERAGQVALNLIAQCRAPAEDDYRNLELAMFAVFPGGEDVREFKERYYKRWDGERVELS